MNENLNLELDLLVLSLNLVLLFSKAHTETVPLNFSGSMADRPASWVQPYVGLNEQLDAPL